MNSRASRLLAASAILFSVSLPARAVNVRLQVLQPQAIHQFGEYCHGMFLKTYKEVQFKVDPDFDRGLGFFAEAEGFGAMPDKGLSEAGIAKAAAGPNGAPLCYFTMSQRYGLLVNGAPVDMKRLRPLRWVSVDGIERDIASILCSVKQLPNGSKELWFFGSEKDPVLKVKFVEGAFDDTRDFAFLAENVADGKLRLTIGLFGKSTAHFEILPAPLTSAPEDVPSTSGPGAAVATKRAKGNAAPRFATPIPGRFLYQFDVARSGFLRDGKLLPKRPRVIWKYPADSELSFAPGDPIVADGVVYFGDQGGHLYAIAADTGEHKWARGPGAGAVRTAPAIVDKHLYLACAGALKCVSRETGEMIWNRDLPLSSGEVSPLVVGDLVYGADGEGFVYALNRKDGAVVWRASLLTNVPPPVKGFERERLLGRLAARPRSAASDGETLFQPIRDQSRLIALDCKTGEQRWSYETRGWIFAAPCVSEKHVFFGSDDLCLHCIERKTGKFVWKVFAGAGMDAPPATMNGDVYFTASNGRVNRYDGDTGKAIWTHRLDPSFSGPRGITCSPLITEDTVYIMACDGQFCALDAATGESRWEMYVANDAEMGSYWPATDGRRFFFVSRVETGRGRAKRGLYAVGD